MGLKQAEAGEVIRCFIGAPPDGLDAESQMVLEHSARSRSSMPVEITWMQQSKEPTSLWYGWNTATWATPFTAYRYAAPYAVQFSGRCCYMDADMIVLGDLAELWNVKLSPGTVMAARGNGSWRFDVCLFDAEAVKPHMLPLYRLKEPDGFQRQNAYFTRRPEIVHSLGGIWNYIDTDTGPLGKIVHYSALATQPHRKLALERLKREGRKHWYRGPTRYPHPRPEIQALFDREYQAALGAGYCPEQYYESQR